MRLKDFLNRFTDELVAVYTKNEAENIGRLVLEHLTGLDLRKNMVTEIKLGEHETNQLHSIMQRLQQAEPVQYILQEAWFYDIPFFVNKEVLIPRPETEELVDWVIKDHLSIKPVSILDIGTGSGCIPIILKRKIPDAIVYACDISYAALEVAKENAKRYGVEISFFHLDILKKENISGLPHVDIIISNPPYIPLSNKESIHPNVLKYEPGIALFVEDDNPHTFYKTIAQAGQQLLNPGGKIYVEIHEDLGNQVMDIFIAANYLTELRKDLQGKDRMVQAQPFLTIAY